VDAEAHRRGEAARRLGRAARAAFCEPGRASVETGEATTQGYRRFGEKFLFWAWQSPQRQIAQRRAGRHTRALRQRRESTRAGVDGTLGAPTSESLLAECAADHGVQRYIIFDVHSTHIGGSSARLYHSEIE